MNLFLKWSYLARFLSLSTDNASLAGDTSTALIWWRISYHISSGIFQPVGKTGQPLFPVRKNYFG